MMVFACGGGEQSLLWLFDRWLFLMAMVFEFRVCAVFLSCALMEASFLCLNGSLVSFSPPVRKYERFRVVAVLH